MEARIALLEEFVVEARAEFRSIDVRLTKIEMRLDSIEDRMATSMATKTDLAMLESTMLKWFIGTTITMVSVAFAAAKLIHQIFSLRIRTRHAAWRIERP